MLEIVVDELKKVVRDFYNISKTMIVLYDEEKRALYSYPEGGMAGFCGRLRKCEAIRQKCFECDRIGFEMTKKTGKPYIYKCHMNLSEAIAPIIENNVVIGYLMLGQVMLDTDRELVKEKISAVSKAYGITESELSEKMNEIQVMDRTSINSAVSIMSMCACYLYVNKIIQNRRDILSYQLKDFIDAHFSEDLTIPKLCEKFYISKSKLYSVSLEAFGTGASEYIRFKRMEHAKNLLLNGNLPISQIAEQSGFDDCNYFIRIFKKYVGETPSKYRKSGFRK